jgi:hypothetical protein
MTKSPVLFLIFNRPDTTKKVFEVIKRNKPQKLYIAADGPRNEKLGEKEKCKETRKVIEKVDWKCEVRRLYRNENLGCKKAVSGAINWFFENEDQGIILEDDCLPSDSFFKYCEVLLNKYKNDKQIYSISGDNFQPERKYKDSYYFTRYPHCWGWATWKRAWKQYDVDMADWEKIKISQAFIDTFPTKTEYYYWKLLLDRMYKGKIDTWDYQWAYTLFKNHGYAIGPSVNLVKNIGFGEEATHTKIMNYSKEVNEIKFPLKHPNQIKLEPEFEEYTRKKVFLINPVSILYQATMLTLNK